MNENQKPKLTGRGGPGRGQGRRTMDEENKRQNYTTKLHPDVIRWLREQGKGNGAGLIESAIVAQYGIKIGGDSKNDTRVRTSRKVNPALELQEPSEP